MPQVTLHLLRHSVASNLLNDGFSVTRVQEWLGHSSAATTLTFYAHVDKTSKLQIANQLDKIDAENGFIQLEGDKKSASEKPKKIKKGRNKTDYMRIFELCCLRFCRGSFVVR